MQNLRSRPATPIVIAITAALALAAAPTCAHVAWPTFYSAKSSIAITAERWRVAVTIEIPLPDLVLAFNQHFANVDLIAEIEKGRIEELENEFRNAQFAKLGAGLEVEIDDRHVAGAWQPVETPINGRGAEGFFVYLLEFEPAMQPALGDRLAIEISNRLFSGSEVTFANLVEAGQGWRVLESSTPQPPPGGDLSPGSADEVAIWSDAAERRTFRVIAARDRSIP